MRNDEFCMKMQQNNINFNINVNALNLSNVSVKYV